MELDDVIRGINSWTDSIEELVTQLKQATGTASNSQLFAHLEGVIGVQRTTMHRWITDGSSKRYPSRQTIAQLRMLLVLLQGECSHHVINGKRVKRRD